MKTKKRLIRLICAAVFLLVIAGLRALNIHVTVASADVTYSDSYVIALDRIHDYATLVAYGFSAAVVVYSCYLSGLRTSLIYASLMSGVIFADRSFCLIYDLAMSNINIREKNTLTTAVIWLATDILFFVLMYFGGALISSAVKSKKEKRSLQNGSETGNGFPFLSIGATVGIMTLLQLLSQLVICIQFFMEYDDVTVTEKTQMLGDILWILVEYGGFLAAFAMISYIFISFLHGKVVKNHKNR